MSHQDQDRHHSDKRRAPRSPSPHCSRPPSRKGRHKRHRRVTARDASPSPNRWCATTTSLLLHNRDHRCPTCLEYQKHVSLDIVLETSSIMDTCEDCLRCLACIFGWNARMSGLEDDLASMRCEHDYWRKRTEEAEKASTFSQQQTSTAFEQARLLSMYIPSARPEDPTGAGPSSRPLEEHLVSPGGGSGVTPVLDRDHNPQVVPASVLTRWAPSSAPWMSTSLSRPGPCWQDSSKTQRKQCFLYLAGEKSLTE